MTDDKRLAELIRLCDEYYQQAGAQLDADVAAALRELQQSRQWIPWACDDPQPKEGEYLVTMDGGGESGVFYTQSLDAREDWPGWGVIAYLPNPLPAPYKPTESKV